MGGVEFLNFSNKTLQGSGRGGGGEGRGIGLPRGELVRSRRILATYEVRGRRKHCVAVTTQHIGGGIGRDSGQGSIILLGKPLDDKKKPRIQRTKGLRLRREDATRVPIFAPRWGGFLRDDR